MEAKAIESTDSIALVCQTISSDHIRTDPVPGGAIPNVYDNRDGRRRAACEGVRRRRLLRRLTRRKIASWYRTLSTEGAPGPPEASNVQAEDGGGPRPPFPPGRRGGHGQKLLNGLWRPKVRIARVATYAVPRTIERV